MEIREIKKPFFGESDIDDIRFEVKDWITMTGVRVQIGHKFVIAYFSHGEYNKDVLIDQVVTKYFPECDGE